MEAPHWILRVVAALADESWWDGVLLGFAIGVAVVFIPFLYFTGR